jgi:hypothetical protein
MNDETTLIGQLRTAVASGAAAAFETSAFDIGMLVLEDGVFPQSVFDTILETLADDKFRSLEGSWKLLRVFEHHWEYLSESQRATLLVTLESAYTHFSDWMACFVISGILGELYQDDRGFATLLRLKNCGEEMPRSFVPHGLEHIATDASDPVLRDRAFAELTAMQADRSEAVSREVRESLGRIAKRQRGDLPPAK